MKHILFTAICLLSFSLSVFVQAQETYDISTFRSPKGWTKQAGPNAILFSTEDKAAGTYCLVTVYKSIPGLTSPKENFNAAWQTIVAGAVTVSAAPQMFPSDNKADWKVEGGYAPFTKEDQKGVVVLYTASGYGKMVNILVLTNTMAYEPTIAGAGAVLAPSGFLKLNDSRNAAMVGS